MGVNLLGILAKKTDLRFLQLWVSGNGTTGMAMAVPVFEGSKNGVAWILTYSCIME